MPMHIMAFAQKIISLFSGIMRRLVKQGRMMADLRLNGSYLTVPMTLMSWSISIMTQPIKALSLI